MGRSPQAYAGCMNTSTYATRFRELLRDELSRQGITREWLINELRVLANPIRPDGTIDSRAIGELSIKTFSDGTPQEVAVRLHDVQQARETLLQLGAEVGPGAETRSEAAGRGWSFVPVDPEISLLPDVWIRVRVVPTRAGSAGRSGAA